MDFDPLYLRNCKFLDHSSYGNFDQHWIAIPTVYKLTWFGGTHFTAKENADVSIHVTVQSVSVKKIVSYDVVMKFHAFITNWIITWKICSKTFHYYFFTILK